MQKKKLLFICLRNLRRSLTAELVLRDVSYFEVRSAGTSPKAKHTVSFKDIEWADLILCMEKKHLQQLERLFGKNNLPQIEILDIEDEYDFMDPELIKILKNHFNLY